MYRFVNHLIWFGFGTHTDFVHADFVIKSNDKHVEEHVKATLC